MSAYIVDHHIPCFWCEYTLIGILKLDQTCLWSFDYSQIFRVECNGQHLLYPSSFIPGYFGWDSINEPMVSHELWDYEVSLVKFLWKAFWVAKMQWIEIFVNTVFCVILWMKQKPVLWLSISIENGQQPIWGEKAIIVSSGHFNLLVWSAYAKRKTKSLYFYLSICHLLHRNSG